MKTNIVKLISGAVASLNDRAITESLCGTGRALVQFCGQVYKHPLPAVLKREGLVHLGKLDHWSLPDAVWAAMCRRNPRLSCYPLGEIAERAVKKVVITLTLQGAASGKRRAGPNLGESEIQKNLRRSLKKKQGQRQLLRIFLSHYFFELCIDNLRRPAKDPNSDLSFKYHFRKDDHVVSLATERRRRQRLADRCEASAKNFLRFLLQGIKKTDPVAAEQQIRKGFARAFGVLLPDGRKTEEPDKPFVNVIVGKRSLAEITKSFFLDKKAKRLLLHADHPNVATPFEILERWLGRPLHSLVKDLLDIGVAVYMSDLYTKRGHDLGRRIGLLMPVRHLKLWRDVQTEVERTVASLGRDDFQIHFVKRREHADTDDFSPKADDRCVCLFSGGLDSMAGAVWALDNGLTPIFVSHHAINRLAGIQNSLLTQLGEIYGRQLTSFRITEKSLENLRSGGFPENDLEKLRSIEDQGFMGTEHFLAILEKAIGSKRTSRHKSVLLKHARELQHLGFYVAKSRSRRARYPLPAPPQSLMAQHLRSFLFLSLAAAVALESQIDKVYMFENGPVALNPLFSEARVNTRTAHPHFLAHFQTLIKTVFRFDLRIENPFAYLTKGEVATILARPELNGLAAKTCSCWNWFRVPLVAKQRVITAAVKAAVKAATKAAGKTAERATVEAAVKAAGEAATEPWVKAAAKAAAAAAVKAAIEAGSKAEVKVVTPAAAVAAAEVALTVTNNEVVKEAVQAAAKAAVEAAGKKATEAEVRKAAKEAVKKVIERASNAAATAAEAAVVKAAAKVKVNVAAKAAASAAAEAAVKVTNNKAVKAAVKAAAKSAVKAAGKGATDAKVRKAAKRAVKKVIEGESKATGKPKDEWRHDGECLPCIIRRTSAHRARLWSKDVKYLTDVFKTYPALSRDTIIALADFLRFCQNMTSLSDTELLMRAPDFSVNEEGVDSQQLVEMYREHAEEVIHCFRKRSNKRLQQDFAPILNE